jgi:SAM-dependent methyltransferase
MVKARFDERPEGMATMSPDMPKAKNYYNWIISKFLPYLGDNILDVGGGYGAHLEYILPEYGRVTSIDLSETSVQFMRERFRNYPDFQAICIDFGQDEALTHLIESKFDTITCLNVLEHIEDDLTVLKDMYAILQAQTGVLLLQVPAHEWLYGTLDIQAGHYRRYSLAYLSDILTKAGFDIVDICYFNSFGALPWFINARVLKSKLEADGVNLQIRLFDRYLVPLLRNVESRIKLPFGQSLMAVAKVKKGR